jgi:hypothetical protein
VKISYVEIKNVSVENIFGGPLANLIFVDCWSLSFKIQNGLKQKVDFPKFSHSFLMISLGFSQSFPRISSRFCQRFSKILIRFFFQDNPGFPQDNP